MILYQLYAQQQCVKHGGKLRQIWWQIASNMVAICVKHGGRPCRLAQPMVKALALRRVQVEEQKPEVVELIALQKTQFLRGPVCAVENPADSFRLALPAISVEPKFALENLLGY